MIDNEDLPQEKVSFEGGLLRYKARSVPTRKWPLGTHEIIDAAVWRACVIEFFITLMVTFFSMLSVVSAIKYGKFSFQRLFSN